MESHNKGSSSSLPPIPAKRYFTIGEVSELCGVKPHVLRYWEQEFTQLKPVKRRGNRRYYQHHEVLLIRRIRELLYEEGFTIAKGPLPHIWYLSFNMQTKPFSDLRVRQAVSKAIDKQGWLHSGDLGTMDETGYVRITGRLKDMIIRAGENIYPREIEDFLYTHPKIVAVAVIVAGEGRRQQGQRCRAARVIATRFVSVIDSGSPRSASLPPSSITTTSGCSGAMRYRRFRSNASIV